MRKEGWYHYRFGNIGDDFSSFGYKRVENTNVADLAISMVNTAASVFLNLHNKDDEKEDIERREYFIAVGIALIYLAKPTDKELEKPLKEIISKWKGVLNRFEQDKEKYEAMIKELEAESKEG